jgi:CRP/FNR family transcriptional regulator
MEASTVQRLSAIYPMIEALSSEDRESVLTQEARYLKVPAGTRLFDQGSPCQGFPMVTSGSVRVARGSSNGRSLELYRVSAGEICVVSASCLFGQSASVAQGDATEATELVLLSPAGFDRWSANPGFRRFVFGVFADRLAEVMALAEAVAFQRLDQRLAATLLGRGTVVRATHQALADELGTVREIISRLLARFERAGHVALARERIDIVDPEALRDLATGSRTA